MESSLQTTTKPGFLKKNYIFIMIMGIICMFGLNSKIALIGSIFVYVAAICLSSNEDRFCWSLFMIPNIRIYDSLGSTSLVNILICLPFFFYLARELTIKRSFLSGAPILMAFFLFMIEFVHSLSSGNPVLPLFGWVLGFAWCCYATLDEKMRFDKSDAIHALAAGIIFSALIYFVNNPWFTSDVINKIMAGYRFEAYANDPNYFSLYICLVLAGTVIKQHLKASDYILIIVLIIFGLMTASKMCFLLMAVSIFYLIIGTNDTINKYIRNFLIVIFGCCAIFLLRDYIGQFIDILLERAGGDEMTLNTLTTGRFDVVMKYLDILENDFSTLIFGKGFTYHKILFYTFTHGSHNTYLDFILAWGLAGTAVLLFCIFYWFEQYKKKLCAVKYAKSSKYPFLVLALSFFALSCFNAGMFFFVIAFCLLQLEPVTKDNDVTEQITERIV